MWPGTPRGRRRRRWAARGGRCWPGCTAAGAGWPSCWRRRGWVMDGPNTDHRLPAGFARGPEGVLASPGPAALADGVAFAVEVAGGGGTAARLQARPGARSGRRARPARRRARHGRRRRARLAGAGMLAAVVTLLLF